MVERLRKWFLAQSGLSQLAIVSALVKIVVDIVVTLFRFSVEKIADRHVSWAAAEAFMNELHKFMFSEVALGFFAASVFFALAPAIWQLLVKHKPIWKKQFLPSSAGAHKGPAPGDANEKREAASPSLPEPQPPPPAQDTAEERQAKHNLLVFAADFVFPCSESYLRAITKLATHDDDEYQAGLTHRHLNKLKNDHITGTPLYALVQSSKEQDRATLSEVQACVEKYRYAMGKLHDELDNLARALRKSGRWNDSYAHALREVESSNELLTAEFRKFARNHIYKVFYTLSPDVRFHKWGQSYTDLIRGVDRRGRRTPSEG
jgi:hypothetical protein